MRLEHEENNRRLTPADLSEGLGGEPVLEKSWLSIGIQVIIYTTPFTGRSGMIIKRFMILYIPVILVLSMAGMGFAQDSADQLLEKARARASEIEKLKKIINEEPDQNVRLAAFDLMISSDDSVMHEIAVEAGLASADNLLQAAAFKAAIMDLERLHLTLVVDKDASEGIRKATQAHLDMKGDQHILSFDKKDVKAGTVKAKYFSGEVIGTHLTYTTRYGNGTLQLKDDNAVSGNFMSRSGKKILKFFTTGKIR